MTRDDLLALTPAALASLSNAGLVKRAERELAAGPAPVIDVGDDGTVRGRFADGTQTAIAPGRGLSASPCSCGASRVCRHRVALVLAYQQHARSPSASRDDAAVGGAASPRDPPEASAHGGALETQPASSTWSPGALSDAALGAACGARVIERAARLRRRGVLAEVRRESPPLVQLATSAVRFLVPHDVAFARCDCHLRTGCEHIVLAVWAARIADALDPHATAVTVAVADDALAPDAALDRALDAAADLASAVLLDGAVHTSAAIAARVALARTALARGHASWPLDALEALEALTAAYREQSANYAPRAFASTLLELWARRESARHASALPAAAVLGTDEVAEARLDRLHLVGLGARFRAEGRERAATLYFCEPRAGGVLVLQRRFRYDEHASPEEGPALGRRIVLGSALSTVATGQLVTTAATRGPNRLVSFGSGTLAATSVLAQPTDFGALPPSLLVRDVAAHLTARRARAPRFLRPRWLAEDLACVAIGALDTVAYVPAAQSVRARVRDPHGQHFGIELAFRSVAPGALAALAVGLAAGARFVVGEIRLDEHGLVVDPLSLALGDGRVIVLDAAAPSPAERAALTALPVTEPVAQGPLAAVLGAVTDVLAEIAHVGLRHAPPDLRARLTDVGRQLGDAGMPRLAAQLARLDATHQAARDTGLVAQESAAVHAWMNAAAATWTARERVHLLG